MPSQSVANLVIGPRPCPAVGLPPVQRVLLCDIYQRLEPDYRAVARSLPGHLIQLTREGRTTHEANGRRYELSRGHLIWYHEDETVRIHIREAPWSFFTLNFIAPTLSPPPFEKRVRKVGRAVFRRFEALLTAWRDTGVDQTTRHLRVQGRIHELLAELSATGEGAERYTTDPLAQLWWNLETKLRQDLSQPVTLARMAALSGRSPATIARSCRAAVGLPPMKRIKQVRLSLAAGLVQRSDLLFKEIAARVGYGRVHELSRDYRRHFGATPSAHRRGRLSSRP